MGRLVLFLYLPAFLAIGLWFIGMARVQAFITSPKRAALGHLLGTSERCRAGPAASKARRASTPSMMATPPPGLVVETVNLPTGINMELVSLPGKKGSPTTSQSPTWLSSLPFGSASPSSSSKGKKAPILFIHGSFHSSWCWLENFMPFFSARGWDTYALSLRGTSKSPAPPGTKSVKISEHVDDVYGLLQEKFIRRGIKPVIVGHSFGGSILMKLLEKYPSVTSQAAFVCSVPPSGNADMTVRFLKRDFILAIKITIGFVLKKAAEWPSLCRELFFTQDLDPDTLLGYMARLKEDCAVSIDVRDFLKELPSLSADPSTGKATWLPQVPSRLVIGAASDNIVDDVGVQETANFVDVTAEVVPTSHDVMLGPSWTLAAGKLLKWLDPQSAQ